MNNKNKGYISIIATALITLMTFLALGAATLNKDEMNVGGNGNVAPLPVRNFLGLTDTPNSYSGQGGKAVVVNAGGTALEFSSASGGGTWGTITGTLSDQTDLQTALDGKVATTVTVNGHALSSNVTVTKSDLSLGNVENTALSTWAGSTNLTTLGTIATGVWNGTAIGDSYISSASTWNGKIDSIADPNADRLFGWDDTDGAYKFITIGTNLSYDHASHTLSASGGASGLTVGTTTITSGTDTKILYNNAGTLGEYTVSGSGNVAMTTSPVFTTPNIGSATGSISGNAGTATALANARTIGGVSFDGTGNITVATATGGFTVSGGDLALGANNLTLTGSIGATAARSTKGWFTDIESTNMPTVGGTSLSSTFAPIGATYITQTANGSLTGEQALGSLATGILKNTTTTGVLSIAVAGDFPTLNQNTTGSAATLTTTRTIWGQNFNGSANVTGSLTAVSDITGGASSMTITSGTGASRTMILRTTTSGSTATTALTLGADQSATFAGTVALGTNNLTMTGSLAATGARVTKGWFTDLESTNMITIGGTSLTTVAQTFQNKTITNSNNVLGGVTMTLGSDADGDIYYRSSGVLTRLAKGTTLQQLRMNAGATAPEWFTATAGASSADVQVFTSGSGNWTKSGTPKRIHVQMWGGGGGGGGACNGCGTAGGGGGGTYSDMWFENGDLGGTIAYAVGAGGTGGVGNADGGAGGNTTFNTTYIAYGGGGGSRANGGSGGGGGGGAGTSAAGSTSSSSCTAGGGGAVLGGTGGGSSTAGGASSVGGGGGGGCGNTGASGGESGFGGGGGGGGSTNFGAPAAGGAGGKSKYGGGGGGGGSSTASPSTAGTSMFGGAGGNSTTSNTNGTNGGVKGGGGGGASSSSGDKNGGTGGAGYLVVTSYY